MVLQRAAEARHGRGSWDANLHFLRDLAKELSADR